MKQKFKTALMLAFVVAVGIFVIFITYKGLTKVGYDNVEQCQECCSG